MALDLTIFNSGVPYVSADNHGTGVFTTSAFTPPDNCLLAVKTWAHANALGVDISSDMTIADSVPLTWDNRVAVGSAESDGGGVVWWTAPVTTGVSMTISVDAGARNVWKYFVEVYALTGYNTGSPTGAIATDPQMALDGADTLTLSGAPASDSIVLAGLGQILSGSAAHTVLQGTGWTERYESTTPSSFSHSHGQSRTGSTSTTVTWDDMDVEGTNQPTVVIGAALEIKAAAGSASLTPTVGSAAFTFNMGSPVTGTIKSPLTP